MTPPQVHIQVEILSSDGNSSRVVWIAPGVHGAGTTGMQGIGVGTPSAAAVAEATSGFVGVIHMPKGMMFSMGT